MSGGLHASEVAGAQHTIKLAYDLLNSADEPKTKAILDEVILFLWPSLNPDGQPSGGASRSAPFGSSSTRRCSAGKAFGAAGFWTTPSGDKPKPRVSPRDRSDPGRRRAPCPAGHTGRRRRLVRVTG